MKDELQLKKVAIITILAMVIAITAYSQENDAENSKVETYTDLGADLVSSYVWRGIMVDPSPNVQGWGEFGIGSLTVGAWASTNFTGTFAETDLYAGYSIGNFTATITNYFAGTDDFYNFEKDNTIHVGELGLQYTVSENIPLQLTLSTLVYGDDKKPETYNADGDTIPGKNNYSTYFELMYPITHGETEIKFVLGGVTHESSFYGNDGLAIINVGIQLAKEVKITEEYSLPIAFGLTTNPNQKSMYAVFSVSF